MTSVPCQGCRSGEPLPFDFTMAFQPIVDLDTASVHGYEALVRGIDGASAANILARVDGTSRYRFDQQCRVRAIELAHRLHLAGLLSINFLPNAVYDPDACIQTTLAVANQLGWAPERICFEITETEYVSDRAHLQNIVNAYREYGFSVALDDFGTGYANLDLLIDMQPNVIKLDRQFISGVDTDTRRQATLRAMVTLAASLGITVVAEGVETLAEARWLYREGIVRHQGYFYARPQIETLPSCEPSLFDEVRAARR